jgi:hypothetical protein
MANGAADVRQKFKPGDPGWLQSHYNRNISPSPTVRPLPAGAIPGTYKWFCAETEITTPGEAAAEGIRRTLFTDLDYVANSDSLASYLAQIARAALSRLTKDVDAKVGGYLKLTTGSNAALLNQAITEYTGSRERVTEQEERSIKDDLLRRLDELLSQLREAETATLPDARAANQEAGRLLFYPGSAGVRGLYQCLGLPLNTTVSPPPNFVPPQYGIRTQVNLMANTTVPQRTVTINNLLAQILTQRTQVTALRTQILNLHLPNDRALLEGAMRTAVITRETAVNNFLTTVRSLAEDIQEMRAAAAANRAECERTR